MSFVTSLEAVALREYFSDVLDPAEHRAASTGKKKKKEKSSFYFEVTISSACDGWRGAVFDAVISTTWSAVGDQNLELLHFGYSSGCIMFSASSRSPVTPRSLVSSASS
ncbi:hypothetical protein AMECASPLE_003219 [Ameca splendens]|uniref:Uncharacterized protein n=1 Tax=Ameca splendens TaxID=208324 RepID=A0ABV0XMI3_9TELE